MVWGPWPQWPWAESRPQINFDSYWKRIVPGFAPTTRQSLGSPGYQLQKARCPTRHPRDFQDYHWNWNWRFPSVCEYWTMHWSPVPLESKEVVVVVWKMKPDLKSKAKLVTDLGGQWPKFILHSVLPAKLKPKMHLRFGKLSLKMFQKVFAWKVSWAKDNEFSFHICWGTRNKKKWVTTCILMLPSNASKHIFRRFYFLLNKLSLSRGKLIFGAKKIERVPSLKLVQVIDEGEALHCPLGTLNNLNTVCCHFKLLDKGPFFLIFPHFRGAI